MAPHTIRLKMHLTTDTLHLPELREFIGKDVEVTINELTDGATPPLPQTKPFDFAAHLGGLPAEAFDGFDEALRRWRRGEQWP